MMICNTLVSEWLKWVTFSVYLLKNHQFPPHIFAISFVTSTLALFAKNIFLYL